MSGVLVEVKWRRDVKSNKEAQMPKRTKLFKNMNSFTQKVRIVKVYLKKVFKRN